MTRTYVVAKRTFDVVVSATALVVLAPLWLVVARLIKAALCLRPENRGITHDPWFRQGR